MVERAIILGSETELIESLYGLSEKSESYSAIFEALDPLRDTIRSTLIGSPVIDFLDEGLWS